MFWIVNGDKFKGNFMIGDKMPSPKARFMKDLQIFAANSKLKYSTGLLRSPDRREKYLLRADPSGNLLLNQAIKEKFDGHHLFRWTHPRTTWYYAKKPVILDFGESGLFMMLQYPRHRFFVVKEILKEELIRKNRGNPLTDIVDQHTAAT